MRLERCSPPECVRPVGHRGECRPNTRGEPCDGWLRIVDEPCARQGGHRGPHRSRYSLDNAARAMRSRTA